MVSLRRGTGMEHELDELFGASSIGRRDLLKYAGIASILAACKKADSGTGGGGTSGATGTSGSRPTIEQEPGGLKVFDWAGYGDGGYYPNLEKKFLWGEYLSKTGDTPTYSTFLSDDQGFTAAAAGTASFDVVHPCGYRYQDWVDLGAVQPWDTSLISNFPKLNPSLEAGGVIDNKQYFVPLDWGFIAPLVNADYVDTSDPSFGILFDDRYAGKIAWVDTLNMLYIAGLYLGVPDPFDMTDDELVQARDFLISKKHLVKFLWNTSYGFWTSFRKEEVWIGYSWPDTVGYAGAAGMNYDYMQPKEGRVSWVCGMGLAADTQNYYHAHDYVDSWASTEAAQFILAYYYYGHTNTEVDLSALPAGVVQALGLDDPSVLAPPKSIPESYIPRRDVYSQYWTEVSAA
jgi:spermidine/putrescine transport system substrate-binding protein